MMTRDPRIDQQIEQGRDASLEQLFRLLKQPSISAQGTGVEQCATLVASLLEEHGIEARIMPTAGFPVVYGERIVDQDANTILFYGHYDVQPPEPYDEWVTPPFEPTIRDGRIYARGSGDNKGQFLAHILAIKLLDDLELMPKVNIKFLIEGEEENGSPSLPAFVEEHRDLLQADLFYAADGPKHPSNRPVVFFGLRGQLSVEINIQGANRDLHSGNFGGPIPNGAWRAVNLLRTMRDPEGRVTIDGFYDAVTPPTELEQELAAKIPFDVKAVKRDLEITDFDGPADLGYYEKLMFQPTLTINGINSGYAGEGSKTVIPSRAKIKLDSRLVPDQTPEGVYAAIERHVKHVAPDAEIRMIAGTMPSKTSPELPVSQTVVEAIGEAYEVEPVVMPLLGASSPNYLFSNVLGLPAIWTTYANPDENNHSPNENLKVTDFLSGIHASTSVLQHFAAMKREDLQSQD